MLKCNYSVCIYIFIYVHVYAPFKDKFDVLESLESLDLLLKEIAEFPIPLHHLNHMIYHLPLAKSGMNSIMYY